MSVHFRKHVLKALRGAHRPVFALRCYAVTGGAPRQRFAALTTVQGKAPGSIIGAGLCGLRDLL